LNIQEELRFRKIGRGDAERNRIRELYERSFPKDERIPFVRLLRFLNEERIMEAVYCDGELIGMTYVFLDEDIIYLAYLCVREDWRDQGLGTRILKHLYDAYPERRFIIDIEETRKEDENYEEELKRRSFYLRNGFESTGIFYRFYNVDYELLSSGGALNRQEWQALLAKHWGVRAKRALYRDK